MIPEADVGSVFEAFRRVADALPDRAFLYAPAVATREYAAGPITYTYREAAGEARRLAAGYAAAGVSAETRVALAYDSRLDVYLHLLALNALGASAVPLNMGASDAEILHVLGHSDSRLTLAAAEHRKRLRGLAADVGCELRTADELLPAAPGPAAEASETSSGPATEAALLYTSGTTGKPKGCMLSNEYFLTLGRWYNSLGGLCRLETGDRLLTPLPPNHMNALCTSFMGMLLCGGCVIQLDRFHASTWWRTVREERASIVHYLGVMPAILLRLPERDSDDFGDQVKFGFGAGADPRHQAVFERRFGFPLIEAWAMTETGAGAVTIAHEEPRHVGERCVGRPAPHMEHRLVDEEDRDVATGEPGELLVRRKGADPRKGFFSGYYKDEAATEAGWRGGWWHTGDVVREGPDGSLYFVDRRKNVIRRSGENIAAVEVEAALLQHPAVENCAVTAVPDEIRGDEVFAYVVLGDREGAGPTVSAGEPASLATALAEHCLERLSYFKAPGYVAFVDELPLTASQKVARGEVKKLAREAVEGEDCFDLRAMKSKSRRSAAQA